MLRGLHEREVSRYWAGLRVLARLSETGMELSSEDMNALLGTRSAKGIGAALSGTRDTLFAAGIRLDEAMVRRTVRGRSMWTSGPRIRQAMHVLDRDRYRWMGGNGQDDVPLETVRPGDAGPVLVLRALKSRGNVYRLYGGMAELEEVLDDPRFEIAEARSESIGEIFIARIEPGSDGREHPVPGAIGTGLRSSMIAWVGEATWVERRLRFVDKPRRCGTFKWGGSGRPEQDE